MANAVAQAGQVEILACQILQANGEGLDILSLVEKVTLFEDIFSPFVSGELVLRDTYDIPNALGRSTRDLLRLEIQTPGMDEKISGYYILYKMTDRQLASDRSQLYTYHFASEELIYDVQRQIAKTYKGTGDTIISSILESKLGSAKKFQFDKPANSLHYVSNYWSPVKNIRYIIENSTEGGNASYVFFENREGFNFKSLTKMVDQPEVMQYFVASDFIAEPDTTNPNSIRFGAVARNPNIDYQIIREIRVDSSFDYLDFLAKGGARTKLVTHDLTTKKYEETNFVLTSDGHKLLNQNRFLEDTVISNTEPILMTASKAYGANGAGDKTNTRFLQKRISQMAQFQGFRMEIDVFGRSDYTVGKKVYLEINQTRKIGVEETQDEFLDKNYSGFYIVSKLAHHIGRKEHMTTIELIKDSTLLK